VADLNGLRWQGNRGIVVTSFGGGRAARQWHNRGLADFGRDAQAGDLACPWREPGGGKAHIQGLMGAGGVVVLPPRVDGGLGVLDGVERRLPGQQLALQGLVQPLDLPGRPRLTGQSRCLQESRQKGSIGLG
jgi:hypothetical protein